MMTLYINRETDGCLDLYVTSGVVYRTDNSTYGYNSRDGMKILIGTFRDRKIDGRSGESMAQQALREWMAAFHYGRIPVQNGSDVALSYEVEQTPEKQPKVKR